MSHDRMHHTATTTGEAATRGVHGMLVLGDRPFYLSHLPMFMAPHNYQVLLRASLDDESAGKLTAFRAHFGNDIICTFEPEEFSITDFRPSDPGQSPLTELSGTLFRGHFEHEADVLSQRATVVIEEVLCFEELPATPSDDLTYRIFGDADGQLFLAHRVSQPPDFDQVLAVRILGAHFTSDELRREGMPDLTIPGRKNAPERRLTARETVAGQTAAGQHFRIDVQVEVLAELYLNEDELR